MNDEMEHKNQETNEQPWSRNFGEEDGATKKRPFSRTARNSSKRQTVTPLSRVLLVVFFAIVIIPSAFILYYYATRTQNNEPKTAEQIMVTKSSSESSVVASSESESSSSSSVVESSSVSSSAEVTSSQESYSEATVSSSSSSTTGEYTFYTVQAGDNLYRIALNHGMDLETLKELNGITGDSISVGTQLKVYAQ